jgi:hypothetical protein
MRHFLSISLLKAAHLFSFYLPLYHLLLRLSFDLDKDRRVWK